MQLNWNRYFYQSETTDGDTGGGGGGGGETPDTPLGEKGQKALEATKQRARELEKKLKEQEELLKKFEGFDLQKAEEALKFQQEAALREAEQKQNTEEARKLEREAAAAEKKRLQDEAQKAKTGESKALVLVADTKIDTAIVLAVSDSTFVETVNRKPLCKIINSVPELKKQLAYLTRVADGVDEDGVYVVDKNNDPVYDPDDKDKYLSITDWVNTKVRADYSGMFLKPVGTGDGLSGKRGRRGSATPTEELSKMNPTQRAEWARKNQPR